MSLTSEQLVDIPAVLLPLYVEGAGSDGQSVPDVGPNDLPGELDYAGTTQTWGYPSAVETDATAREYRGYGEGVGGTDGHSRITVPHDAAMTVSGDFACAGVVRVMHSIESAGTFVLIQKQGSGGIAISTVDSLNPRLAGFCFDTNTIPQLWVVSDLTFALADFLGQPFYVVVERVGDTLAIRVNGELRNTKTIGSGLPTLSNTSPFTIHSSPGAYDVRYSNAGWYTHALGGTRSLAHYEAMINATLLSATSNVIPTAILYSDIEPDPVKFAFRHNWDDSLIERISFRTARSTAIKGYESSNGQRPKPRREIEISQVLRDNDERQSFRARLTAQQHAKWLIPILEDREQLTTTLSAGSTLMPATTEFRDYEVGGYVELRQVNDATGVIEQHETALIMSLSPLTTTPITNTYAAFISTISPVRRGIIEAQVSPRGHTDTVEEVSLVAWLIAEDEQVIPNRIIPWTPTLTYHGYEVFDISAWQSNDWTELRDYRVERDRSEIDFDTGSFAVESDSLAATESFGYRMLLEGRDKQAALLGWFYARAGALNYLWVPTVQRDFNVVSVASNTLTVAMHNYFDNFAGSEFRRDLAFIYHDNTMQFRRIDAVALAGANEVLSLNTTVPTLTNLRSVSYLRFCRLDGDSLEIARATDAKARFAWGFREMLSSPA